MIVVKIEMWPGGHQERARELQRVLITNVGGDAKTGIYDVVIPKSPEYATREGIWRQGRVTNFPRQRLGPADLLLRALIACAADRSRRDVQGLGDPDLSPSLSHNAEGV